MQNTKAILKPMLLVAALLLGSSSAACAVGAVDWVVLVDGSGTMRHQERGARTVDGIEELVSLTRRGDRVSIVSYGERTALALPSSPVAITDEASRDYVRTNTDIRFVADRTDITAGLEYIWNERDTLFPGLVPGSGSRSDAVIVLLTDGKLVPVYDDYANYDGIYGRSRARLLELASLFGEQGIRICTIALGREEKVDGDLMRTVAKRAGGTFRQVVSASDVVEAYRGVAVEQRPAVTETPRAKGEARGKSRRGFGLQDVASASDEPRGPLSEGDPAEHANESSASAITAFPSDFCLGSASVLGILIGLVAVGSQKRQRWAARFSTALFGTGERRVRGYLKPVDPPGTNSARANIGLENPGVDTIKIGNGTAFLPHLETTVEFIGTTDGTTPELCVESGRVTIEGEEVTSRKLRDGDILELEGVLYQYLRGNRR